MLPRTLLHIYGPFCIYSYGLMIALGTFITYYMFKKHPKRASIISNDVLPNVVTIIILAGVIGGRTLYILGSKNPIQSWLDVCAVHEGGLSVLGAVIAILLIVPWYLHRNKVRVLPFFDLFAIFAPLLQSISRLGCFFAGCCYGKITTLPWSVIYTSTDTLAPRMCSLHPTQLYASGLLMLLFIWLYYSAQHIFKKPGQLTCLYLLGTGCIRFIVDYYRADREFLGSATDGLSLHQWIALGLMMSACIGFIVFSYNKKNNS